MDEAAGVGDLALLAAARFGAALSLLELELCELERAFSPLADEEVSDLLFDRNERLSAGIFLQLEARLSKKRLQEPGNGGRGKKRTNVRGREASLQRTDEGTRVGIEEPRKIRKDERWGFGE